MTPTCVTAGDWRAFVARRGLRVPAGVVVPVGSSLAGVAQAAAGLRPPLVLKALGPRIVHKTEVRAVRLGLPDSGAAAAAAAEMLDELARRDLLPVEGFLVEEMAPAGVELLLGVRPDPRFGPMMVFGAGGTAVEARGEARFFALPLRPFDVDTVLETLPWLARALARLGGEAMPAIRDAIWRFGGPGGLGLDAEVVELEVNPLIVGPRGAVAVDVRGRRETAGC